MRSSKLTGPLHFPFQPGNAACKLLHDQASCPLLPWNQEEHAAQEQHCQAFTDQMQPNSRLLLTQTACRTAHTAALLAHDHAHIIVVVTKSRLHPLVILCWIKVALQQCIQGCAVRPSCPCHGLQALHPAAQQGPCQAC